MRAVSILTAILALLGAHSAFGEATQAGGDFTFKRVGVPGSGVGKRIKVQIDPTQEIFRITPGGEPRRPGDPRPEAATRLPDGLVPSKPTDFDWFWETVSPSRAVDIATRFQAALELTVSDAVRIGTPRLETLRRITSEHGSDILKASIGTEVSPALVLAVIAVESAGRSNARSHAGAQGLMQLMPDTAKRFGVSNSLDAGQNIEGGIAYLDWLLKEFDRDPIMALAGYNAGEGAVGKYDGVPPFAETRGYVPKVLAAWTVARQLCRTPPDLLTDGCVFVTSPQLASN